MARGQVCRRGKFQSLGRQDGLEEGMTARSVSLAGTSYGQRPRGLQYKRLQRDMTK